MWTNYMNWLHGLPLWGQVVITSFQWSFAAALPLAILAQRYQLRSGRSFDPKRWHIVAFFVTAFYVRNSTAWGMEAATWPERYIAHWTDYWLCIVLAGLIAAVLAGKISSAYTAWQSRGTRPERYADGGGAPEFFSMADPDGFASGRD